jgi:hypothetical protein
MFRNLTTSLAWRLVVKEAKAHPGLQRQVKKKAKGTICLETWESSHLTDYKVS